MANYLLPAGNIAPIQSAARSRDDVIHVNDMYRMQLYNKKRSVQFTGFIPPDFSMSLASSWGSPYANTSLLELGNSLGPKAGAIGEAASAGVKLGGGSSMTKAASAKVWGGPTFLQIEMPVFLDAYADTRKEVVNNIVELLSLGAPSEGPLGFLIPPGPAPLTTILTSGATESQKNRPALEDDEAFTVDIGKFFSMSPVVIDSVVASFDNVMEDGTGNPITCDFVLSISSYFAVTREDLRKWFKVSKSTNGA